MPTAPEVKEALRAIEGFLVDAGKVIFLGIGVYVAARHIKEFLADHLNRFFKPGDHRVRIKIVKDVMSPEHTQRTMLRRLRVSKRRTTLTLENWPLVIPEDRKLQRRADVQAFYSMPGRLTTEEDPYWELEKKFKLILERDEVLKPHREYPTVLGYTINETIDVLLSPPVFVAFQPVGTKRFIYEIHFPKGRHFAKDKDGLPQIKVHTTVYDKAARKDREFELVREPFELKGGAGRKSGMQLKNTLRPRYHVIGGRTDFRDKSERHDWFRVTILNPPQRRSIYICWCMEGDAKIPWWLAETEPATAMKPPLNPLETTGGGSGH